MPEFLAAFALLLVPVILILIVRLRRRQKLRYPHTFLRPFRDQRLHDFLLRTFQLYHDVLVDLLAAALLALVLSGLFGRLTGPPPAVCLDGSWSMLRGGPDAPLDRALRLILEDELGLRDYRLYLLGFDPRRGRSTLWPLRGLRRLHSVAEARERLLERYRFVLADAGQLLRLRQRGCSRVVLLTDRRAAASPPFEVVEVGQAARSFYYPLSLSFDFSAGTHRVVIARQGFTAPLVVERFDEAAGAYLQAAAAERPLPGRGGGWAAEALSLVELKESGLFRLRASPGGEELSFVLDAADPRLPATVRGTYSRLLLEVLPQLREGEGETLLADLPYRSGDAARLPGRIRALGGFPRKLITLLPEAGAAGGDRLPLLYPLQEAFSGVCSTEVPPELLGVQAEAGVELYFQDPARPADPDTPLVYLQSLWRAGSAPASGGRLDPARGGATSWVYAPRGGRPRVVNVPPEEFFPVEAGLPAQEAAGRQLPAARAAPCAALLALYLLKLVFLYRLRSRRGLDRP